MNEAQLAKVAHGTGFIAALDQSGGSTPEALAQYGIPESQYPTTDEMFELMHELRTRIITAPAFSGKRILGAILFEQTMDRDVAAPALRNTYGSARTSSPSSRSTKASRPKRTACG